MELKDNVPLKKIRPPKQSMSDASLTVSAGELPSISGSLGLIDDNKQKNDNSPAKVTSRTRRKKRSSQLPSVQDKSEMRKSKAKDKKLKTESQTELQNDFYIDPTLVGHIEDLREDIIHCNEAFRPSALSSVSQKDVNSPNKFYLQCTYGFKEINRSSERSRKSLSYNKDEHKVVPENSSSVPISVALNSQHVFLIVSTICQGLLAGLVLWHCLMVFFLRQHPFTLDDFYFHYSFMAYPFQAIIYFLHAVSLLSVLDRCDFGFSLKNFCYSFITFNPIVYLVVLYTVAFMLSLAIKKTEDRVVLEVSYKIKTNSTESSFKSVDQEYNEWWIMTIARTIILVISWILISVYPNRCQLTSHMKEVL